MNTPSTAPDPAERQYALAILVDNTTLRRLPSLHPAILRPALDQMLPYLLQVNKDRVRVITELFPAAPADTWPAEWRDRPILVLEAEGADTLGRTFTEVARWLDEQVKAYSPFGLEVSGPVVRRLPDGAWQNV